MFGLAGVELIRFIKFCPHPGWSRPGGVYGLDIDAPKDIHPATHQVPTGVQLRARSGNFQSIPNEDGPTCRQALRWYAGRPGRHLE